MQDGIELSMADSATELCTLEPSSLLHVAMIVSFDSVNQCLLRSPKTGKYVIQDL